MSVYARIVYVSFPWNRVKLIRRKEASSAFSNRRFYEPSLSRAVNVEGGNDECEPRCLSNRLPALTSIKQVSRRWKRKRESGATSTEGRTWLGGKVARRERREETHGVIGTKDYRTSGV